MDKILDFRTVWRVVHICSSKCISDIIIPRWAKGKMIYDFSWCIWIKNGSWSCFDTDLEKLLFLFRNTKEKWETHFCPSWHLILHYSSEVEKKVWPFYRNVKMSTYFFKDFIFSTLLNISGQKWDGISCGANFNKREMEQKKIIR